MTHFESKPADAFGFKEVLYEKGDWVARITINRPHNYNAYSTPALEELATAFRDAAFDDSISVIVYTGAGHHAFCTGGDVKEYEKLYTQRPRDYWKYMRLFRAYIESIVNAGKPVVARLNGMAVGGGFEIALEVFGSIEERGTLALEIIQQLFRLILSYKTDEQWQVFILHHRIFCNESVFLPESVD